MAARPSSAGARIESAVAPPGQPAVGEGGGHSWPTCTRSRAAEGVAGVGGTYGEGEGRRRQRVNDYAALTRVNDCADLGVAVHVLWLRSTNSRVNDCADLGVAVRVLMTTQH